jgi:hypothetical protein
MDIKIKITTGDENYGVKIFSADSEAFRYTVEQLKEIIPPPLRSYDPTKKIWMITDWDYLNDWLEVLRGNYPIETEFSSTQSSSPPPAQKQNITSPFQTLYLLPDAPPEVVKASYKALAKIHHPDAHGSSEKMIEINRAYETLTREGR